MTAPRNDATAPLQRGPAQFQGYPNMTRAESLQLLQRQHRHRLNPLPSLLAAPGIEARRARVSSR